jgi:hypothetical protein
MLFSGFLNPFFPPRPLSIRQIHRFLGLIGHVCVLLDLDIAIVLNLCSLLMSGPHGEPGCTHMYKLQVQGQFMQVFGMMRVIWTLVFEIRVKRDRGARHNRPPLYRVPPPPPSVAPTLLQEAESLAASLTYFVWALWVTGIYYWREERRELQADKRVVIEYSVGGFREVGRVDIWHRLVKDFVDINIQGM